MFSLLVVNVSNFPAFAGAPGQVTPASGAFRLHLNCGDIRPEVVALSSDSDVWKTKMEYLNAGPITNFGVRDSPGGGRIGVR